MSSTVELARALRPLDLLDALDVLTLLAETGDRRLRATAAHVVVGDCSRQLAERDQQRGDAGLVGLSGG